MKSGTVPKGGHKRPMTRGAVEALAYVLQFSTASVSGGHVWSLHQWRGKRAQNGDLVILKCAPASPWCIGWLIEGGGGVGSPTCSDRYLIENLLDRRRAWWANVDLHVLDEARNHPRWRWSDEQIAFAERWYKVVRRGSCFGYAVAAQFDGNSAWLGVTSVHRWQLDHAGQRVESEPVSCKTSVVDFRKTRVVDLQAILVELNLSLVEEEHARGVR